MFRYQDEDDDKQRKGGGEQDAVGYVLVFVSIFRHCRLYFTVNRVWDYVLKHKFKNAKQSMMMHVSLWLLTKQEKNIADTSRRR